MTKMRAMTTPMRSKITIASTQNRHAQTHLPNDRRLLTRTRPHTHSFVCTPLPLFLYSRSVVSWTYYCKQRNCRTHAKTSHTHQEGSVTGAFGMVEKMVAAQGK